MKALLPLAAALILCGCNQSDDVLSARVERLERDMRGQQTAITNNANGFERLGYFVRTNEMAVDHRITALEWENIKRDTHPAVVLDASSQPAFQTVSTSVGKLLILLRSAEPYLDGFKVKVGIGNPYAFVLGGLNASVRVGTNKVQKFDWPVDFRSGYWTDVEMILSPASATDVKAISVWLHTDKVAMPNASK